MKRRGLVLVALAAAAGGYASVWAGPECTCRANGQNYKEGQITCIRGKLARCEMFLNNTSWKIIGEMCPEARLDRQEPLLALLLPAAPNRPPAKRQP